MHLTQEEKDEIREMRSRTPPVPWKQIAEWIGCSVSTARYHGSEKVREQIIAKGTRTYHRKKFDSEYVKKRRASCNAWYAKHKGKRTLKKVLLGDIQ